MFKQKIKVSLIEDYIDLLRIDKMLLNCDNYKCLKHYVLNEHLKNSYESLFLKFGLLNVSFLVLKQEIESISIKKTISLNEVEVLQTNIVNRMIEKLKKLKLNEIEIKFLTKKLI